MKNPKIRFKGFMDGWEQRKLGEVFEEYSEKNHPELPALTIIQGGGTILREESDRNLQYDKSSLSGYKMVSENDLIVHLRSFEGGLEKANHNGLISPAYHTFHGIEIDSRFYYPYFRSFEFIHHKLVPHVYGIRDGRSIDIEGMKTISIPWTTYEEQKRIGDYIDALDTLITLRQRKCEEIKILKKYMLQKMFPQNGSNIPEIRFDGFNNTWEQRKVCDMSKTTYGGGTPKTVIKEYWNGDIPWIQSSDIVEHDVLNVSPRRYISYDAIKNSAAKIIPKNSLAIVTRVGVGKLAIMPFEYASSQDFLSLSNLSTDINFTAYALYNKLQNEMNAVQGTSIKGITKEEVLNKELCVPNLEEQRKVGMYFTNLDNFITLYQRKCNELENIKKFMLQNMFV